MKKSRLAFLLLGSFLLGVIISAAIVWMVWEHVADRFAAVSAAGTASVDMATLQCLQTGDTNHAVELLNVNLDSEVIAVGSFAEYHTSLRYDPLLLGVLRRVRDYRVKYPYKESPDGQMLMTKAFDLVGGPKVH
jgi:hypothetical protein